MQYIQIPTDLFNYHIFWLTDDEVDPIKELLQKYGLNPGDWSENESMSMLTFEGGIEDFSALNDELETIAEEMVEEYLNAISGNLVDEFQITI